MKDSLIKYRPLSYWAWLDYIAAPVQAAQAQRLLAGGYGGFVVHARGGLTVPYLGKEWKEAARACAAVAEEHGALAVFGDEYGWPSGFGGGRVMALGDDCCLKVLRAKEVASEAEVPAGALVFCDGAGKVLPQRVFPCFCVYAETVREYSDNLSPRAVEEFIRAGYEPYKCGSGYFTDEPQLARGGTPYSNELLALFFAATGKELAPLLPALFFPAPDAPAVRCAYYSLVAKTFRDNYVRRIQAWCAARGRTLYGHFCWEENLALQIRCNGAVMPLYEYLDVPGVDALQRDPPDDLCVLQMTSAAEQLGKPRKLSESFGAAGWNISIADRRYIAEKQMVLGVNMLLDHLALGSLRGSRKREFPASLSPAQPWWKYNRLYTDPIARLSRRLANASYSPSVLVLHPMQTAFCEFCDFPPRPDDPSLRLPSENCLREVTDLLLRGNYAFHYGDETLLSEHGSVCGGKLRVGEAAYTVAVLPGMRTVSRPVFGLLRTFAACGGKIFCTHTRPALCDGKEDAAVSAFFGTVPLCTPAELGEKLPALAPRPLCTENVQCGPVYVRTVREGKTLSHYLVNTDRFRAAEFDVACAAKNLCVWQPETGRYAGTLPGRHIKLEGGCSLWLTERAGAPLPAENWRECGRFARAEITARDKNVLVLDCAQLSEDGGAYSPPEYLPEIQSRLLRRQRNGRVSLRYTFTVSPGFSGSLLLAAEDAEHSEIYFNGEKISFRRSGHWLDPSIRTADIGAPRPGENVIELSRFFYCSEEAYRVRNSAVHEAAGNRVTVDTELESLYILGDFEVRAQCAGTGEHGSVFFRPQFEILPPSAEHSLSDFTSDGFPFFAGALTARVRFRGEEGKRYRLRFAAPSAIVISVRCNGREEGAAAHAPYTVALQNARPGENEAEITFYGSLRNAFGPSHLLVGESYVVSPGHFQKLGPDMFTENYASVRFGAGDAAILECTEIV